MCTAIAGRSQIVYVDIATEVAMNGYASMLKGQQNRTNANLSAIAAGQAGVMLELEAANSLQKKVLRGLTEISGTLSNAMAVKEISDAVVDVFAEMSEAVRIAAANPAYAAFASQSASELRMRALAMAGEVGRVLTGGEANMMDAGERQKLLNYINTEVRLMAATAYGVRHSIEWARRKGLWNSLGPFAEWVNRDRQIMDDILRKAEQIRY